MQGPIPASTFDGVSRRAAATAAGLVLDRLAGEPPVPDRCHPVALFGAAMGALERRTYADRRAPGALLAAAGLATAAGAGAVVRSPTVAAYIATSGRALHRAALDVADALADDDPAGARQRLPALVARDPSGLDATGIARAAVESVAENTTDAIVAPALWTAVAGAPGALAHRAADTLDSMVGYRDDRYRRYGTGAARVDDVLAWVPARATAALVAATRPRRAGPVLRTVRRDAPAHPSPNAGVAEAAFAGALGLRLGEGENRYGGVVDRRPPLGDGRAPTAADVRAAVALSRDVTWALVAVLAGVAAVSATLRRTTGARS